MCMPYSYIETWCFNVWISLLRKDTLIKITFVLRSYGSILTLMDAKKIYLSIYLSTYSSILILLSWLNHSGKSCSTCTGPTHQLWWWRGPDRCLLGFVLPFRWNWWQNSSSYWCGSIQTSGLSFAVRVLRSCWFILFNLFSVLSFKWLYQSSLTFSTGTCTEDCWQHSYGRWCSDSGKLSIWYNNLICNKMVRLSIKYCR